MSTYRISAGTTEKQEFQAQVNEVAGVYTGSTIALLVWDRYGTAVTPITGAVDWEDAPTGVWSYTPDGQLTAALSPYTVRLEVTAVDGVLHSPNEQGGGPDIWYIVSP